MSAVSVHGGAERHWKRPRRQRGVAACVTAKICRKIGRRPDGVDLLGNVCHAAYAVFARKTYGTAIVFRFQPATRAQAG